MICLKTHLSFYNIHRVYIEIPFEDESILGLVIGAVLTADTDTENSILAALVLTLVNNDVHRVYQLRDQEFSLSRI